MILRAVASLGSSKSVAMFLEFTLLLAVVASAAARGGAIPLLACAETLEFWHFAHPELNFASAFASFFAVFYSRKVSQPPGCTVQKRVDLCISHCFFRCVPVCVAFCMGFHSTFADSQLSAHAGLDLHFSFSSVWGVEG